MSHLIFTSQSAATNKKLLEERYQDSAYENIVNALARIEGLAGFVADASVCSLETGFKAELDLNNLEVIARVVANEAKEILIMFGDLRHSEQEVSHVL
jgi:hypothetical protein